MNTELLAANLTAHWIQAGLLAASALLALLVLRVNEPRVKMTALQGVLVLTLLLPWVQPWRATQTALSTAAPVAALSTVSTDASAISAVQAVSPPRVDPTNLLLIAIASGIVARLLWIAFGLFHVHRLLRTARPIDTPAIAEQLEPQLGISARYVEHSTAAGPSTLGIFQPTIALPAEFDDLTPGFQRAVVCHELLHVKRRDTLVSLLEECLVAVFWFHPLIWLVRHQIRVAREQAVDATVLDVVGNRAEYVRCLVEMSGHDLMPHLSRAGAAMIRSRELRARVNAIFQEVRMTRLRRVMVSMAIVSVIAMTGWSAAIYAPLQAKAPMIGVAGYSRTLMPAIDALEAATTPGMVKIPTRVIQVPVPVAQAPAPSGAARKQIKVSYAEYPADALEKGISGMVTVNIIVNPGGEVSTAAVVDGPQELRSSAFKAAMGLKYTPASSTSAITIAVEYRMDRQSWGVRIVERATPGSLSPRLTETTTATTDLYGRRRTESGAVRVGGDVQPPKKVKDASPVYPALALNARVQGVVILETTVDEAGNVSDAKVLRSIPLLDQAAIDAVRQWQYTPTMLNGQPVSVVMTVTVNFTLRGSGDMVVLKITFPDGMAKLEVADGGIAYLPTRDGGIGQFRLSPTIVEPAAATSPVRVFISQIVDGVQRVLGTVEVVPGGGAVQAATSPPFSIELLERTPPPSPVNVTIQ